MSNPIDEIEALKSAYDQAVDEKGQSVVDHIFQAFLTDNPEIHAVKWEQYTPYFNDGSPCVFSLGDPRIVVIKDDNSVFKPLEDQDYYGDDEHWEFETYQSLGRWSSETRTYETVTPELDKIGENLKALNKDFYRVEDILESVFGDHVQVTATRDGYEVDDYSHD